jgi:hypothetical protein
MLGLKDSVAADGQTVSEMPDSDIVIQQDIDTNLGRNQW